MRRDAHSNPEAEPPFFLNAIGKWYLTEVSLKDEAGKPVKRMRGLYCTNCHNHLAHALYLTGPIAATPSLRRGETLRNRPIGEVIGKIAGPMPSGSGRFLPTPGRGSG